MNFILPLQNNKKMKIPDKPEHEQERIKALREFNIVGTLPEKEYDDITQMASFICKTLKNPN